MSAPKVPPQGVAGYPEVVVWAYALWFVVTDSRAAFEAITTATWSAFLTTLGWSSVARDLPSGRIAYWRRGDGVTVRVYEGAFDYGTRVDDTARRLAQALGIPTDMLLAGVLVFQHLRLYGRVDPVVVATVEADEVQDATPRPSVVGAPSRALDVPPRRPAKAPPPLGAFLAAHPALVEVLCEVGRREVGQGARRIDVRGLFRVVRESPDLAQRVRPQGGRLVLNHYHTPELGRMVLAACPDLAPFLRLRKRAHEASVALAKAVRS